MKTTKKALSVLLAVIMIMSSMSVCFGSISFTASAAGGTASSATTAEWNALIAALKNDTVKDAVFSGSANNYSVKDDTAGSIMKAVNAYWTVFTKIANLGTAPASGTKDSSGNAVGTTNITGSDDGNLTINVINETIKSALSSKMGNDYSTYNVANFIGNLIAGANVTAKSSNTLTMTSHYSFGSRGSDNNKTVPDSDLTAVADIKLTVNSPTITEFTLENLPDSILTSKTYTVSHKGDKFDYTYSRSGGGSRLNPYSYQRTYTYFNYISAIKATEGSSISTATIKAAETVFDTYSDYIDADGVSDILALSDDVDTLNNVLSALTTNKDAVEKAHSAEIFSHFFPDVAGAITDITETIEFLGFGDTIANINRLYGVDYTRMDKAATLAHLTEFKEAYKVYEDLTEDTKELICDHYDFEPAAIEAKIAEVQARYDALCIMEEKAKIDTHVSTYQWTIDDVDENRVTKSQLVAAAAQIATDISVISKYPAGLVSEICGADYITNLQALKSDLEYLAEAAGYNDDYLARYEKFINEVQPATSANLDDAAYLEVAKNYDSWNTQLKALINEMKAVLGEEDANKLYDEVNDMMLDYLEAFYTVLNVKVETQINTAYDLWVAYTDLYGTSVNFTSVSQYNYMRKSVGLIDLDAYEFLQSAESIRISQDAINKYNKIKDAFPAYEEFLSSFGFSQYQQSTMDDIVREDTIDDIARENADIDSDNIGEYVTKDADIEKIITKLDALLNNAEIQELLGKLINKDKETGEWTGESFDLGGMLEDLIKGALFTDNMINTVIGMLYPLVVTEFIKVWANDLPAKNGDYAITYIKSLYTIFKEAGFNVYPDLLATSLKNVDATKYAENIALLNAATNNFKNANGGQYYTLKLNDDGDKMVADKTPWDEAVLKKDAVDDDGNVIYENEETGEIKQVWALDWGVDAYRESIEADGKVTAEEQAAFDTYFYQTFDDAVDGLKPLLLALLGNKAWNPSEVDHIADTKHKVLITLDVEVGLQLGATANRGYANLIIPVFEALGITSFKAASTVEGYSNNANPAADILKAILDPIFNFANTTLKNAPLTTILNLLPNLAYALITDMVPELLSMLKTSITYQAVPYIIGGNIDVSSFVDISGGADIDVGTMLDLESMGVDLSDGLNSLLPGFGLNLPNIDQGKLATMGTLGTISTGRADWIYTKPADGKAYHINANKADVLVFLLQYVLGSGLLGQFLTVPEEEGLVKDLLTNLMDPANTDNVLAALVELLNAKVYNTLRNYEWYNGSINGESVVGKSAYEIYMNPGNDWTEEKAEYLYNNLDAIVGAILTMAKLDLDKETEEIDGSLGGVIGGAIDGLLSDKTLTSLAALLAKLDLNALLAPKADEETTEGEGEAATVAEGEEAESEATAAIDIDINGLVKELLGIDLETVAATYAPIAEALEADEEYVYDFGVDAGTTTFAAALADMLAPLSDVLDFILAGENLEITISETQKVELIGYNGYNNAIIPLLEALGCTVTASADLGETSELEATLTALIDRIDALTEGEAIKNIIDILPGVFYYIASKGLSVSVRNLLQPVYVILDTIRPIIDVNLNELINGLLPEDSGMSINIDDIGIEFIFDLLENLLLKDADLGTLFDGLKDLIYDICDTVGVDYSDTAKSTLQTEWKKGAYSDDFTQADLLTVVLSFILEWATVEENAAKLDELLKTEGLISSITTALSGVEVSYTTPNWMYWFTTEEEFNAYIANGSAALPNTLLALEYPNDWNEETAQYIADELPELVDMVIGLINKDKEDAPKTLSALLGDLINGYLTKDSLDQLVDLIVNLLSNIDATLIETAGVLLDADIVGLEDYEAPEIVATEDTTLTEAFAAELANLLDDHAGRIVNWLFFEDSYEFAKKSDNTDTIVINGGLGYEKGLALILEALGCELPAEANTKSVLGALAERVDEILANPVDEVIELLPNLVYFLNANGAGAVVSNLLAPVVALLDALAIEGVKLDLAELIKITKDDGTEAKLDLSKLTLANIVDFVESLTGLDLTAVEEILVDFCVGKIEEGEYIYKMTADKSDVVTIVLTTALLVLENEQNAEVIGVDAIAALDEVFKSAPVTYETPDWDYCWDENGEIIDNTIPVIDSALTYPNDWTEETSQYVAANLSKLVDMVIGLIEIDGVKYESLAALIDAKLDIYTDDNLAAIQTALGDLIGGLDGDLKNIVDVALGAADSLLGADVNGLINYNVEGANGKEAFVDALTGMLMEVEGLVDWLLLGEDYELFVDDDGDMVYEDGEAIITLNGGHGYAEGLALLLEALGCENLPTVYDVKTIDTEATVKAVLTSLANRIDEVLDNPVDEVIDLLPNLIYFLNTNGVAAVIDNLIGAINALLIKLEGVGLEVNINELVNLKKIMNIEDTDAAISLDNLSMADILEAVSLMTGLDLTILEGTLNGFALGEVKAYDSVSRTDVTFKMQYKDDFDKADMITVLVTAVLNVLNTGDNAEKIDEMANTNLVSAIRDVFMGGTVVYSSPNWDYTNDTKYEVIYPNNWTEATAEYVADNLVEIGDMIAGLIDSNYATLSDLLNDKVNVFTTENLDKLVELINNLLKDIDATLIEGAGLLLGAKLVGEGSLATYKAPAGIDTAKEFAAELANVLNTYAPGVVEWLLLGESYKFFVEDPNENGIYENGEDAITISGAQGYAEGLALLLEALGCKNLPEVYNEDGTAKELDTKATVEAVLASVADRIDEIFANPVVEVVNLLPNLFYFLNTNGVAAVVDNLTAGITALLGKLEALGVNLDINELVNLKKLMGLEDTDATIDLDNLAMKDILQAVSLMVDIDLTYIEKVLVNFNLGEVAAYDSVSQYAGTPKKMTYVTTFEDHDMITVVANLLLITLADAKNEAVIKDLLGEEIYDVVLDVLNLEEAEAPVQYMDWKATDKVGQIFNAFETSELYEGYGYGPRYTKEMAQYIADNIGTFIDNIIYLLGIQINGESVDSLTELLENLVGGSLYNSDLVITIRDAIAGLASGIEGLEVNGKVVGNHIVEILKAAEIADIKAVGNVYVPEFSDDKAQFIASICDVLEPLYPVLTWLLADEDLAFFVDTDKSDFITLPGAEGYRTGIALLLEAIGCENLPATLNGEGEAVVLAILNPLLARLDEILANPAEEILAVLTNVIYFINSNGIDVVVKNTLNAVYTVLAAIEPIAKVDLYELVGLDAIVTLSAEELISMLLEKLEIAGFKFTEVPVDTFAELTVGKLTKYTSISAEGENAYKMVYDAEYADEADMITVILRLVITFILTDNNREVLVDLLESELGMSADAKTYVEAVLKLLADCTIDNQLGMDSALATIYYIYYGADVAVGDMADGKKDLNEQWKKKIDELNSSANSEETKVGNLITDILDIVFNDEGDIPEGGGNDVLDKDGVASNGALSFFDRIKIFFQEIVEFFKNLFSFGR